MKTRWLLGLGCLVGLAALMIQWSVISRLRHQLADLHADPQRPGPEKHAAAASEAQPGELEQWRKEKNELLRLRDEVRQLREQTAWSRAASTGTARPSPSQPKQPQDESIRSLGAAASKGDLAAVEKLGELARAARGMRTTNGGGEVFADIRTAFDALASEAGQGNATALQSLIRASRTDGLQALAVKALGKAAGQGNEQALEPLLDPERYFLLRSTVVSALQPAADLGNVRAIQALAGVAGDPTAKPLWLMTAQGLQGAARAGNSDAIDALSLLVRSENQSVRRVAFTALESAAIQHPRAADTLRSLGGQ